MTIKSNHLRVTLIFTLVGILLITIFNPVRASADTVTKENANGILQWAPDGGITLTTSLIAQSIITYSGKSGSTITFTQSDGSVRIPPGYDYGASTCGTQINVRNYTSMSDPFQSSSTISLPYTSSYWSEPGTYAISGKNSGSGWTRQIGGTFTATFQNEGYAQPMPDKCIGGGTASVTLTFKN